ncbi:MAG TPA: TolC family protein, partial [Nitrospirales bacterium]|nr:TolC family protein [Nitrospirales bacterium]
LMLVLCAGAAFDRAAVAADPVAPKAQPEKSTPPMLRLSLDDALGLFLKQNLTLIMTAFGVDTAKGQQITARLFPNPNLTVGTLTSFASSLTLKNSGQVTTSVQQLFETAGKRGFRIQSAAFGTQTAEASFEDAIRQLGFTVKDAYYRVQLAQRRLALAEENRDRFSRILEVNSIRFKKGYIAEVDLIRIRLQVVDFQSQVIQYIQESDQARADLRTLLAISPSVDLLLTTELDYHRVDPDIEPLRVAAIETRPDIRVRRLTQSQRDADLKLAKAYRYPDVTVGGGYAFQGSHGPDNPQQFGLNVGVPLPLFNRNQGGIMQAEVAAQVAETDLRKTILQVETDVDVAYRNLVQSRRLVEAYRAGVLEDARLTLTIVEKAYERGGATILDLLDAARTSRTIQQNYVETLFNYQRNVFLLESAVGREITS